MPSHIDIRAWIDNSSTSLASLRTAKAVLPKKRRLPLKDMTENAVNIDQHTPKRPKHGQHPDKDATPTQPPFSRTSLSFAPSQHPTTLNSSLPLYPSAPYFGQEAGSSSVQKRGAQDNVSDSSGRSSKKSRGSMSPQKELAAREELEVISFNIWEALPPEVQVMVRYFEEVGHNRQSILPWSWRDKDDVCNALAEHDSRIREEFPALFGHVTDRPVPLSQIRRLIEKSKENKSRLVCEAHWNCTVHWPVLEIALEHSAASTGIRCDNITNASILPIFANLAARKVDFCFSHSPGFAALNCLEGLGISKISHTDYHPLLKQIIGISIETKVDMQNEHEAQLQLATWGEAQIANLRRLLLAANNPNARIPPIPMIAAFGYQWKLWFIYEGHGNKCTLASEDGLELGNTQTILGCYKLITGIQHLIRWMQKDWIPWCEKEIVGPLLVPSGE